MILRTRINSTVCFLPKINAIYNVNFQLLKNGENRKLYVPGNALRKQ